MVALLAEGVDRNRTPTGTVTSAPVALLAEGVDRNRPPQHFTRPRKRSPSLRRAWIEIRLLLPLCAGAFVALLTEGVDRNRQPEPQAQRFDRRPPYGGRG